MPVISASGRWKQEKEEFKTIFTDVLMWSAGLLNLCLPGPMPWDSYEEA